MIKYTGAYFDVGQIHRSGQCFRMEETKEGHYEVCAADKYVKVQKSEDGWQFLCSSEDYEGFWRHYFDLEADYGSFRDKIDKKDIYLTAASEFGSGIRILNQDLWEMIITFLISQQNNIPRIRKCIKNICACYGEKKENGFGGYYDTFPSPEALSRASEDDLRALNLGYRSKYIAVTAKRIAGGEVDLTSIKSMVYPEAKEALTKLYGVGQKVADCICLFGLHQMEAFPVDTHIRQVMDRRYTEGFPFERYGGCQGLMQQYIFYYDLLCPEAKGE